MILTLPLLSGLQHACATWHHVTGFDRLPIVHESVGRVDHEVDATDERPGRVGMRDVGDRSFGGKCALSVQLPQRHYALARR